MRRTELRDLIEFLGADHVLTADQTDEIDCAPRTCGHQVPAVVRDGRRVWAEDPAVAALRGDDRLLVLSSAPVGD